MESMHVTKTLKRSNERARRNVRKAIIRVIGDYKGAGCVTARKRISWYLGLIYFAPIQTSDRKWSKRVCSFFFLGYLLYISSHQEVF